MAAENNSIISLLSRKEELKSEIKRAKKKVKAQEKIIENQKQRAAKGQDNNLAFEQKQLPLFISELQNVESELTEVNIKIKAYELNKNKLKVHKDSECDSRGFPINDEGKQIPILDENDNIMLPLKSNLLVKFNEGLFIKFNPYIKKEVHSALDTLVKVLTQDFIKKVESSFTIDLSDEIKRERHLRVTPAVVPIVQIYFDWVDGWLEYLGNIVSNIEFKLLFYSKYKEKIKKDLISLETNLNNKNIPENYIEYAGKWLKSTDKNIELEKQAKQKKENDENSKNTISNDIRINLIDLHDHIYNEEPLYEYDAYLRFFKEQKYLNVNYQNRKYKIYSPGLAYLFSSNDVNGKNMETSDVLKIDTRPYFNTFIEAFKKGEKHFESDYEVTKDILYGSNSNMIVSDIHRAYFHTLHKDNFNGWKDVIHSNPLIITHKIIEDYGYYSGVLSKADEFISKYPSVFKDFDKCKTGNQSKIISDVQTKNKIAHELIGDNTTRSSSVEYYHIKEILNRYSITEVEARQILLDMKGSFNAEQNKIIVEPIILYLERSRGGLKEDNEVRKHVDKDSKHYSQMNLKEFLTSLIENKSSILEAENYFETLTKNGNLDKMLTLKNEMELFKKEYSLKFIENNQNTIVDKMVSSLDIGKNTIIENKDIDENYSDFKLYNAVLDLVNEAIISSEKDSSVLDENGSFDKKYLKDIFKKPDKYYDKVIDLLVENKFITKNDDDTLNWIFKKSDELKSISKMLVALFVVLDKKDYLILEPTTPYVNIENEFGKPISKSTFSRYSKGLKEAYEIKDDRLKKHNVNFKYISLFDKIL